ncbi:MAG TPA: amidohydrolase family protein [Myxococcaceae bacterium]|nr:amidohydrolase family protein [Myxococcaceae bacterium]
MSGHRHSPLLVAVALAVGCAPHWSGQSVDAHAHYDPAGRLRPRSGASAGDLTQEMGPAQVERVVLLAVAPATAEPSEVRQVNDQLQAYARAHPGRILAVGALPVTDGEAALRELERVASLGFQGVKLSPERLDLGTSEVRALVIRASALHLVVYVEGWWPDAAYQVAKLALAAPQARLVLTHLGGVRFTDALVFRVLDLHPFTPRNVWFDLSGVAALYVDSPDTGQLRWVCRQVGMDRVLFGSDWPLTSLEEATSSVQRLGFTAAEQTQVFRDNAEALFRW